MSRNACLGAQAEQLRRRELRAGAHGRGSLLGVVEARDDLPLDDARADGGVDGDDLSRVARSDADGVLDREPSGRAQQAGDVSGRHERGLARARGRDAAGRVPRDDCRPDADDGQPQSEATLRGRPPRAACGAAWA